MATLYIREYASAPLHFGNVLAVGVEPGTDQTPLTVGSETKSAAFASNTRFVRVHTDAVCSIAFGASPTATTNNARMAAGATEYFGVVGGHKLSVISNS